MRCVIPKPVNPPKDHENVRSEVVKQPRDHVRRLAARIDLSPDQVRGREEGL